MNPSVIRNLAILSVVTALVVWLSYSITFDLSFFSIPIVIGVGGYLCVGAFLVKFGYVMVPILVLGIWWLPSALASPDAEASGLMMLYLTIWTGGAVVVLGLLALGKHMAKRRKSA